MFSQASIALIVSLFVLCGCNNKDENKEVLARVGGSVLTKEDMLVSNPEYSASDIENRVTQWVNVELLYLAGLNAGLNKDVTIINKIDEYSKKVIGQTYLDFMLQSRVQVSIEEIKSFYIDQQETFRRKQGEALIYSFTSETETDANKIRAILEKGEGNKKRNELFEKHNVSVASVKEGELLPIINKSVFGGSKTKYVGPVKTGGGFAVIEIIKRFPKGTYRALDDVYDNIYLIIQKRKAAIQSVSIVDSLKQEYLLELNIVEK